MKTMGQFWMIRSPQNLNVKILASSEAINKWGALLVSPINRSLLANDTFGI